MTKFARTIRYSMTVFLLLSMASSVPAKGDRKDRSRAKLQKAYFSKIDQVAFAIKSLIKNNRAATYNVRAVVDDEDLKLAAKKLQESLYAHFLMRGLMVFALENERKIDVTYDEGKLPKTMVSKETIDYLAKKKVPWLIIPKLAVSKNKYSLSIEIVDVKNRKYVPRTKVVSFSSKGVTFEELVQFESLPELNLAILNFAISNISEKVDRGACWDLPGTLLREKGVRVDGYDFGKKVHWKEALPGDVITFGTSGKTGGHVVVLLHYAADPRQATVLHQNWDGKFVTIGNLAKIKKNKPGQAVTIYRPQRR